VSQASRHPGLQSERTLLAWVRTAATLSTVGVASAGLALRHGAGGVVAIAFGFATLCGALLLVRTRVRFRRVELALHEGAALDDQVDALLAWLGVLAVVAGSFVLVLSV
jgi:uncharacterized membrane protein YidH (DUF202 family)